MTTARRRWEQSLAVAVVLLITAGAVIAMVGGRATEPGAPRPAAGFTQVRGTASRIHLSATTFDPVPFPVDLAFGDRGSAGLTVSGVLVEGRLQTITWTSGGPLRIHGSMPLVLDTAVAVEVSPAGTTVALDGAVGHLTPGEYRIEGDVALGESGLAQPVDRVDFTATPGAALRFTGTAQLRLPPTDQMREGPGAVIIEGALELTTSDGTSRSGRLEVDVRPYSLELHHEGATVAIEGEIGAAPDSAGARQRR